MLMSCKVRHYRRNEQTFCQKIDKYAICDNMCHAASAHILEKWNMLSETT